MFGFALVFFVTFHGLIPKKKAFSNDEKHYYIDPLFLRMTMPFLSPIMGDIYWLKAVAVSEIVAIVEGRYVNDETFYKRYLEIAKLNPYFLQPIMYSSTFLYSIRENYKLGSDLILEAIKLNSQDYRLYEQLLVLNISYHETFDYEFIKNIVAVASKLDGFKAFLVEALFKARKDMGKAHLISEDLRWLKKIAKNKAQIKEIEAKIKASKEIK